ncbi:MAG: hypothetical protein K2J06_06045 [Muribaculaceae bacterium]|nr:hypothetical protein [Muribaculaceae bacterium]
MKRVLSFVACLCVVLLALTACGGNGSKGSNELIGKWKQVVDQSGVKAVTVYDFEEDGILEQSLSVTGEYPKTEIVGEAKAKYEYEDGVISFTFSGSDMTFSKFEIEGLPDDMIEMAKEQTLSSMVDMKQQMENVKIDGNKLTATFNGQEIEMTRQ